MLESILTDSGLISQFVNAGAGRQVLRWGQNRGCAGCPGFAGCGRRPVPDLDPHTGTAGEMNRALWIIAATTLFWALVYGQNTQSPIHFAYRPIDFNLESS